jgi:hypothetical protein
MTEYPDSKAARKSEERVGETDAETTQVTEATQEEETEGTETADELPQ